MMEIKIGIGLDNIIFGMQQQEIIDLIGKPDKINDLHVELENKIIFYYNAKMMKLKFDKNESLKLYAIEVANPNVVMLNDKLIGKNNNEITNILKQNNITKIEYIKYSSFDTLFCEEIWTTFEFEYDKLRTIEFSPLFKNENEIIWP